MKVLSLLAVTGSCYGTIAWTSLPTITRRLVGQLSANANEHNENKNSVSSSFERIVISGVSVSKTGFHVLAQTSEGTLPLPVTRDPQDSYTSTSPESLTILQLLSGVDMAGAVLPPETLSKLAVVYSENKQTNQQVGESTVEDMEKAETLIWEQVLTSLQLVASSSTSSTTPTSYVDAHPWLQSRVKLPQATLDQCTLRYTSKGTWQCQLDCALPELADVLSIEVTPDLVKHVCYNFHPEVSSLFTCLALAMRYKAPIVLETTSETKIPYPKDLNENFPSRTTAAKLQKQSMRVTENIERGFEIHKLTGALKIAREKGDTAAAERIRALLDAYDSMDGLPTAAREERLQEQSVGEDDKLDDLDRNILQ